jgi:hypothetical protein
MLSYFTLGAHQTYSGIDIVAGKECVGDIYLGRGRVADCEASML